MKCSQCGADAPAGSAFCPQCGAALSAGVAARPTGAARMQPNAVHDLAEEELWTGGYSSKAMTGTFIAAIILGIAVFIGGSFFPPIGWMVAGGFVVLMFLYLGVVLLFRRVSVSYRLTSQRLIIERGVLGRTNDRVLVVEIDDLSVKQGAFERMFDVGTIVLDTKDKTTLDGATPNAANVGGEGVLTMSGIDNPSHVADLIDEARHAELRAARIVYSQRVGKFTRVLRAHLAAGSGYRAFRFWLIICGTGRLG